MISIQICKSCTQRFFIEGILINEAKNMWVLCSNLTLKYELGIFSNKQIYMFNLTEHHTFVFSFQ